MDYRKWLIVVLCLSFAARAVHAADSCVAPCTKPPANARHLSTPGPVAAPAYPAPLLTTAPLTTLAKGKKKRVVVVEATVSSAAPFAPFVLAVSADVNGIAMQPTGFAVPPGPSLDCGGTALNPPLPAHFACTLNATFWLDIDANPALVGVPLIVTLTGATLAAPGPPIIASMTVRLEKK